jgi:predicted  nucleic acid-binding Zn-ribbon protein
MQIDVKEGRTASAVQGEINALQTLISRRNEWLNKEENRLRTTYSAVAADTEAMRVKIDELKRELDSLL